MSISRRKIKNSALACLSVTLCATLSAGTLLANFDVKNFAGGTASDSLPFTEVTRDFDSASLSAQNFNSSVLAAPKASYETRSVIVTLETTALPTQRAMAKRSLNLPNLRLGSGFCVQSTRSRRAF